MNAVRNLAPEGLATSRALCYSLKRWLTQLASGIGHSLPHDPTSASNHRDCKA